MDRYDNTYFQQRALQDEAILSKVKIYASEQAQLRLRKEAQSIASLDLSDRVQKSLDYLILMANEEESAIIKQVEEASKLYDRNFKESIYVMNTLVGEQLSTQHINSQEIVKLKIGVLKELMDTYVIQEAKAEKKIQGHKKENRQLFIIAFIAIMISGIFLIRWV